MQRALPFVAALLGLAACQREPEVSVENASVEEVAGEVAQATGDEANRIRPGRWASTMTIEELSAPGLPAEIGERMKSTMGEGQSHESCLTEEQSKRPREEFFAGRNHQCRYDHFRMGGGKIDARMRCGQGEVSQLMDMSGTYSPTDYRLRMTTRTEGAGPAGGMTMRMRVDARRVGECTKTTAA
jgi:hypothetical protein